MLLSADQFAKAVITAGLSSADEIKTLWNGLPAGQRPKDGETFAQVLIQREKLTQFQAKEILTGGATPLVLGDYILLAKIGAGGMGQVFKARHRRMDRLVAIKLLPSSMTKDEAAIKRFEREVKAAARLSHPNIVVAYDAGRAKGQNYLAMEYVEGTDLSSHVKRRGPLAVRPALDCILQAARGLEYAHRNGVVHRDIKPANLLLDKEGTLKILDMGLARLDSAGANQDELTGTGQIMGTVDYMPPEQALDTKHADARADIYSLGVSRWYLLAGRALYEGESIMATLLAHREKAIPSLRQASPSVPPALDAVFAKMVAKRPADRYQKMQEVIAALTACQVEEGTAGDPRTIASTLDDPYRTNPNLDLREGIAAPRSLAQEAALVVAVRPSPASPEAVPDTFVSQPSESATSPLVSTSLPVVVARPAKVHKLLLGPWWRNPLVLVAAGSGGLLLFLAAVVVFFVQTKDGLIRVEIDDPQIEVAIKGTEIVFKQADQGKDVRLSAGEKTLIVQRGDFTFETNKLVLKKGKNVTVRVERVGSRVDVMQGDKLLGQANLPARTPRAPAVKQAPPRDYALEFDGKASYVEIPSLQFEEVKTNPRQPFTIETFVSAHSLTATTGGEIRTIIGRTPVYLSQVGGLNEVNSWQFSIQDAAENSIFTYQSSLPLEQVVHLAGVYDGRTIHFFVDGKLDPEKKAYEISNGEARAAGEDFALSSQYASNPTFVGFGYRRDDKQQTLFGVFHGVIDEVRISNVARYDKDFTPKTRFETDKDTLALYHFDEGQGDVLKDSSGRNHHGTIVGAKWVAGLAVAKEPAKTPDYAKERAVAEWVLSIGGTVQVQEGGTSPYRIVAKPPLPDQPFQVVQIVLDRNPRVADVDLARFQSLTKLRSVSLIDNPQITDPGMVALAQIPTLEVINLQQTAVTDVGLAKLVHLPPLRVLTLISTRVTEEGVLLLAGVERLESLSLGNLPVTIQGLRALKKLPLQEIEVYGTQLQYSDLPELVTLFPGLQRFDGRSLRGDVGAGLSPLAKLANLEQLAVLAKDVTVGPPNHLETFPRLRRLTMYFSPFPTGLAAQFEQLPRVTELYLLDPQIDNMAFAQLCANTTLERLQLHDWSGGDADVLRLADMKKLRRLSLRRTKVTAAGAEQFHTRRPDVTLGGDFNIPAAKQAPAGSSGK
ncbi:MAG: protein kinase domain-containing protein [Pirellulaceae bacterium]